jgi:hypothetical protein
MNPGIDMTPAPAHSIFHVPTGLSSPEAAERLARYGPNDPAPTFRVDSEGVMVELLQRGKP